MEDELLDKQKLQGLSTCDDVIACLMHRFHSDKKALSASFPLISRIHAIARSGANPSTLFDWQRPKSKL